MSTYHLSSLARQDLHEIWDYIALDSGPLAADRVLLDLFAAIDMLVGMPHAGHVREDIAPAALRVWVVHSYLIVYWPDHSPLSVARVVHGHRDLALISMPLPE